MPMPMKVRYIFTVKETHQRMVGTAEELKVIIPQLIRDGKLDEDTILLFNHPLDGDIEPTVQEVLRAL